MEERKAEDLESEKPKSVSKKDAEEAKKIAKE